MLPIFCFAQRTVVLGRVTDAVNGQPLSQISIIFSGSTHGTSTDSSGRFVLTGQGVFSKIIVSGIGYRQAVRVITPGTENRVQVKLSADETELREVSISGGKSKPYRNKNNPAVELIRQVISHKDQNRMQSADYLQYQQYERIGFTLVNIPKLLVNNFLFRPYRFMLDTVEGKLSAQVYLNEKHYQSYLRKNPEKTIRVLDAEKEGNIIKFIDTTGLNSYLNRFYGEQIDLYQNNLFVLNTEFLSPIADLSPDFYKFFIADTIHSVEGTLVELNFVPRNKGDLLFEGHLLVTLDGRYAVTTCKMQIDGQINLNFVRKLEIDLDFEKQAAGRYFLKRSVTKADFGVLKNKGFGVKGERLVNYSNYVLDAPLEADFYKGNPERVMLGSDKPGAVFWQHGRPDSLTTQQSVFYKRVGRLEIMPSFRRATWLAATFTGGYADTGPFQFNLNDLLTYGQLDGLRLGVGGRTTPKFNRTIYIDGYLAEGFSDKKLKDRVSIYYAFNQLPFYRYPNNYLKISQQYDVSLPGGSFSGGSLSTPFGAFQSGGNRYYFYADNIKLDYVKEYANHFSFDIGLTSRDQQAAGALQYTINDAQHTVVNQITSNTLNLSLRYAPHEQLIQGTEGRLIFESRNPIFTFQAVHGFKGVFNGAYNYTGFTADVEKRFYLSQLGTADVTVTGNMVAGQVPYPLLNISPANQSFVYDPNAYNLMKDLEFVSDHYAGINIEQSFNGFFLNKTPVIKHLKWREFLTFKALYGGLRAENNPAQTIGLYNFPAPAAGSTGTYMFTNTPYLEAGAGIGNIFKFLRVDAIRRFNYLDHPGVSQYGFKMALKIGL